MEDKREKCENYSKKDIDISLFEVEERQWCTLKDEECIFEGNKEVCPYKLGIYY